MTIQLYYPLKDEQRFVDDVRVTRGIAFDTYLPDGTKVFSIRTDEKMAETLLIKPVKNWKEVRND